jgi:hypothetical protein
MMTRRKLLAMGTLTPVLASIRGCNDRCHASKLKVLERPRQFPRRTFAVPEEMHARLFDHFWMLFGEDSDLSVGSRLHRLRVLAQLSQQSNRVAADTITREISALVDGRGLSERYGQPDVIYRSGEGYRFLCSKFSSAINHRSCPSHVFQEIAVLAELGIPSTLQIVLSDGTKCVLSQGVKECARFVQMRDSDAMEPEWATFVFAAYLDLTNPWSNRWDETISISEWTQYLLSRDPTRFGCGGTHLFHSLAILHQLDRTEGVLNAKVRQALDERINQLVAKVASNQNEAGTWSGGCLTHAPYRFDTHIYSLDVQDLFMAGHVLEALSMLHPSCDVPDETIANAIQFLLGAILKVERLVDNNYCPVTHCASVLLGGCTHAA